MVQPNEYLAIFTGSYETNNFLRQIPMRLSFIAYRMVGLNSHFLQGFNFEAFPFKKSIRLVPYGTVHKCTNCPPFGTRGSLTLDIAIYSYIITPLFIIFYIILYRYRILQGRYLSGVYDGALEADAQDGASNLL